MEWQKIKSYEANPKGTEFPIGFEFLGYNKDWVDEDFNPQGIRVVTVIDQVAVATDYTDSNYTDNVELCFCSAVWNNEQDCYDTDEETRPTHWMPIPKPPKR